MDPLKIYCQFFWMKAWGHSTAKRTFVVSNLPRISFLDCGSMTRSQLSSTVETTTTYVSKDGRKRFKGNANLKATELLAQLSVFHVVPFWYYPFPFPNLVGNWTADLSWIADPFPTTCHFPAGFLLPQKKSNSHGPSPWAWGFIRGPMSSSSWALRRRANKICHNLVDGQRGWAGVSHQVIWVIQKLSGNVSKWGCANGWTKPFIFD